MPFRVRCPRCGQTAEITEEHLGRQGQCNNCGALVAIPARLSKVCFVCGVDVTHIGHTKDEHSNYLCTNCFATRKPAEQSQFFAPRLECSICHVHFPREEASTSTTGPICRECATILQNEQSADAPIPFASDIPVAAEVPHRTTFDSSAQPAATAVADPPAIEDLERIKPVSRPPIPQIYTTPTAQFTRARAPVAPSQRLPLLLSSIALVGVVILAVLHFNSAYRMGPQLRSGPSGIDPDNADVQTSFRILILKSEAETLIESGKVREGIEKYDTLLRISSSNPTIAAEIESAKSARENALKLLAAATTQHAEEKPTPAAAPQEKSKTIFNE